MENQITIRQLNKNDSQLYRQIRLESLKNYPDSFGVTYEEEIIREESFFEQALLKEDKINVTFGAFDNENLIGVVCFKKEIQLKSKHKGDLLQMYVKKEFQNKKIGQKLLQAIVAYCFEHISELETIRLRVVSKNKSAFTIYGNVGFENYATEYNFFKHNGNYSDLVLMKLDRNNYNTKPETPKQSSSH